MTSVHVLSAGKNAENILVPTSSKKYLNYESMHAGERLIVDESRDHDGGDRGVYFGGDLEQIAYTILLLIIDGRQATPVSKDQTRHRQIHIDDDEDDDETDQLNETTYVTKEGSHSKLNTETLMIKLYDLSCSNNEYFPNYKQSKLFGKKLCDDQIHICQTKTNQQCQIALNLKLNIEKCMKDHLNFLIPNHHFRYYHRHHCYQPSYKDIQYIKTQQIRHQQEQQDHQQQHKDQETTIIQREVDLNGFDCHKSLTSIKDINFKLPTDYFIDEDNDITNLNINNNNNNNLNDTQLKSNLIETNSSITNISIDLYLLADCCRNELTSNTNIKIKSTLIDLTNVLNQLGSNQDQEELPFTFELIERWNISMITNKKNNDSNLNTKSLLTVNELFQAIRSYLHFSQISSWINQTKGVLHNNIAFSVTYSNEKDLTAELEPSSSSPTTKACSPDSAQLDNDDLATTSKNIRESSSLITTSTTNTTTTTKSKYLNTKEFDYHTFPSINLLFTNTNNKIHFINNKKSSSNLFTNLNQNTKNQTYSNSIFGVSLYSRKRSHQSNFNNSTIPCTSTNTTTGIPHLNCNKLHLFNGNNNNNNKTMNNNFSISSTTGKIVNQAASMPIPIQKDEQYDLSIDSSNSSCSKLRLTSPSFWSSLIISPSNSTVSTTTTTTSSSQSTTTTTTPTSPNDTLLDTLLKQQDEFNFNFGLNSNRNEFLTPKSSAHTTPQQEFKLNILSKTNGPITTPTSFPDISLFHNNKSNSPKVLVSQYQLVSDLCTYTKSKLKLNVSDQNNNSNSEANLNSCSHCNENSIREDHEEEEELVINNNKRKLQSLTSNISSISEMTSLSTSPSSTSPTLLEPSTSKKFYLDLPELMTSEINNNKNDSNQLTNKNNNCNTGDSIKQSHYNQTNSNSNSNSSQKLIQLNQLKYSSFEQFTSNSNEEPIILLSNSNNNSNNFSYNCTYSNNNNNNNNSIDDNNDSDKINRNKPIQKYHRSSFQLSSSPAPMRKIGSSFGFDNSLKDPKSIKNALTIQKTMNLNELNIDIQKEKNEEDNINNNNSAGELADNSSSNYNNNNNNNNNKRISKLKTTNFKSSNIRLSYSNSNLSSVQINPSRLLGSFEESLLNGRMNPVGVVDGFYAEIGASGSFFPEHATLPVYASFYQVCEDIAASPYLGIINLNSLGKRGYKVPNKGTIQVTLFNPNKTVVKMFVVMYDLSDMPPNYRTFLRQRTMYVPSNKSDESSDASQELKSYLRYLIHLRFSTSKSGKMYLHTNIKLIFARNKCEIDPRLGRYEYKTFTEAPKNPKYSPKK